MLYKGNGKENGNYYLGFKVPELIWQLATGSFAFQIPRKWKIRWKVLRIVYWDLGYDMGLYSDNGKLNENYYSILGKGVWYGVV